MQVTINRAQLLYAARCAASIAPGSSTIKEMTGTLLETDAASGMLTVTATNTELSLEQKLPCVSCEEDALVVNARLLAAMVEKFSGDKVELSRSGHSPQLRLVSGDTEYTVPIFEKGGFPYVCGCLRKKKNAWRAVPAVVDSPRRPTFAA